MLLQPNKKESNMFNTLSKSEVGATLEAFILRLIREVESVRTKIDLNDKERCAVADVLEGNFINRFKTLRGEVESPDPDEHI